MKRTYSTKGLLAATGVGLGVALFATLVNLVAAAWGIYFVIRVAQHVGAWPF